MPVIIPADISDIKKKLADPNLGKKPEEKKNDPNRGAGADAAEARRKAREMAKTVEEKDALLQQMQDDLAAAKKEAEEAKAKIAEFEPHANNWKQYEHRERETLIAKLPPEMKKQAKDWPIDALKAFAGKSSATSGAGSEKLDRKTMTDDDMAKLAQSNPEKFLELLETKK